MTGSGSATGRTALGQVTVECRSVNGRGIAVKTRLAPECQGMESAVEGIVRSRVQRGTVYVAVAVDEPAAGTESRLDAALAEAVAGELEALAERLGTSVELADVLAFPGVVPTASRAQPRVSRELPADVAQLLGRALDALVESRGRDGAATAEALRAEIDAIEAQVAAVAAQAPAVVADYREKLLQRVNEFLEGRARAMEPADVIREVAMFADRVDVSEELQRLAAHTRQARELLASGAAAGRKLEFLVQEMLREVNTVGSKSPDVRIAHHVVEVKSGIDRLKEQAANLE